jgi:lambda family phage portal protein
MAVPVKRGRGRPPSQATLIQRAVAEQLAHRGGKGLRPQMRYDAAGTGRRMAGWIAPSTGPNRAITGLQIIRNRSRDSTRNDWSGESSVQKWTTNLIGVGITPRFRRVAKSRRQAITDLWADFVDQVDADCVNNLYGMQTLVVRSWLESGEVFARRRWREMDYGVKVPVQVQILESDMVPHVFDVDTFPGLPANNVIRSGIELNKRGKRVAYWVFKNHPGDVGVSSFTPNAEDLVRVAASDMVHVFEQRRPGQLRGVSMLAPVLARLRNIENYDDATLTRQQLANLLVGFVTRPTPTAVDAGDLDPLTGEPLVEGPLGALVGLQPGMMQELAPGEDVKWSNPPEAGTDYTAYMRTQHMGTAAAAGVPYELFAGDIANISDRTLRVIINEFRRFAEQRQWQIIIPMFCQPVVQWFAEALVFAGTITAAEMDNVRRVEHAPHGWAYIHPVQDPQGKALEVTNNFRSRSSVIGERGDDPEAVDQEIADDEARQKKLKIGPYSEQPPPTTKPPGSGQPPTQPDAGGNDDGKDKPPKASVEDEAIVGRIEALLEAF